MRKLLLSCCVMLSVSALAAPPQVVTSIKPIQSLAAQVMDGVAEPALLITQGSPHGYQMKPSDASAISKADLVIYASDELETFLPAVLEKANVAHVIEWEKIPNVNPLPTRHGGAWAEGDEDDHDHEHGHKHDDHDHEHGHKHDDHDHEHGHKHDDHDHEHGHKHDDHDHEHGHKHDDHDHEHGHKHDDHDHEHGHKHDDHDHEHGDKHDEHEHDHHGHHHGQYDAHLWLDTARSQLLLDQIAAELSEIDPNNASRYQANAEKARANLDALNEQINKQLAPVQKRPYLVFHDAYQYFEKDHGLNALGTVRVDPEHEPGAKRIGELHKMMKDNEIICVFSEPQFPAKIVDKLIAGTKVKTAVLDPVGADLPTGKEMHANLLRNIANNLSACLAD